VPLFDGNGAFWALVSGLFATTGIIARAGIYHVADTVIADLENIRADILTDTATGAKIGIDSGNTHLNSSFGNYKRPNISKGASGVQGAWGRGHRGYGT
jgi:hypothetical protein